MVLVMDEPNPSNSNTSEEPQLRDSVSAGELSPSSPAPLESTGSHWRPRHFLSSPCSRETETSNRTHNLRVVVRRPQFNCKLDTFSAQFHLRTHYLLNPKSNLSKTRDPIFSWGQGVFSTKRLAAVYLTPKAPTSLEQKIGINQNLKPRGPDANTHPIISSASSLASSSSSSFSSSCNYRPAVILPGLGNNSGDYHKLQLTLKDYGIATVVAKISRIDWLRNAAGLADPNYWQGTLRPRPVLDWYLKRVHEAIQEAKELARGGSLSLIGHSAGGWLARVYMEEFELSHISLLLTLGTPHLPPPKGSPGVIDQTRGLLNYVEKHCSKAVYTSELKYVCIAGRYIQGARFFGNSNDVKEDGVAMHNAGTTTEVIVPAPPTTTFSLRSCFVGQGYKQVCGRAEVWGDGVVPEESAHLDGALNISLDGVYHSPVGSDDALRPWYGSPSAVQQWIHHLLT